MPDLLDAEGVDLPPPLRPSKRPTRKCLMCSKKFISTHKFNRLCRKCNDKIETKGYGGNPFDEHSDM